MRERKFNFVVLVTILALVFCAFPGSLATVFADFKPDLELIVKVNENATYTPVTSFWAPGREKIKIVK